jgi:hypothetical protein
VFVPFHILNWKGKVAGAIKMAGARLGNRGGGHNLVFVAEKRNPAEN